MMECSQVRRDAGKLNLGRTFASHASVSQKLRQDVTHAVGRSGPMVATSWCCWRRARFYNRKSRKAADYLPLHHHPRLDLHLVGDNMSSPVQVRTLRTLELSPPPDAPLTRPPRVSPAGSSPPLLARRPPPPPSRPSRSTRPPRAASCASATVGVLWQPLARALRVVPALGGD